MRRTDSARYAGFDGSLANSCCFLLHPFSEKALARPETYQTLIGYLDHPNPPVRDLAFEHLAFLVPEVARKIPYDSLAKPVERQTSIAQWRKLIPKNQVPFQLPAVPK